MSVHAAHQHTPGMTGRVTVGLVRRGNQILDRLFGVRLTRSTDLWSNKHADAAIAGLRRWRPHDVVFDVGANDGRTALRLAPLLNGARIYAFEPVASTYATLVSRTAHLPNIRPQRYALGATPGMQPIYLDAISAMNSFHAQWTGRASGVEEVEVYTVDDMMAALAIDLVHFLKVDTEGFELEVLRGAERALAGSRIGIVQLEVGVGQLPKPLLPLEVAREYLAQRGYRLYGLYNQCRTPAAPPATWNDEERHLFRAEVLAYCDALFVRADLP